VRASERARANAPTIYKGGYAIVNALASLGIGLNTNGAIPEEAAVGFIVGWILLACIGVAIAVVFTWFFVMRLVGLLERVPEQVDVSNPQAVLSTVNPRFAL